MPNINADSLNNPGVNFENRSTDHAAPGAGRAMLYIKDGAVYVRLDTGDPVAVGGVVALAEGQLAIGDGSGQLSALALGTEGYLVTADASGHATWQEPTGGGTPTQPGPLNGRNLVNGAAFSSIGAGTFILTTATTYPNMFFLRQATGQAANLDNVSYEIYLPAGTYTLEFMHLKTGSGGIVDIDLDGTEIGSVDQYQVTTSVAVLEVASLTVTADTHTLLFRVDGKHASSSAYNMYIAHFVFLKTA